MSGDIEDAAGMLRSAPLTLPVAEAQLAPCRAALLSWYDEHHRVLPWRHNSHSKRQTSAGVVSASWATGCEGGLSKADWAYGVWVSEVMLQQTQVERASDYFTRWVARWPTLRALAAASEEEVNEQWAGLGYYRRARFLLQAARYAVANTGGELPSSRAELLKLPGIGAYTASAVSSIAFGQASAAVDGNVVRVLSRLHALAQENPTAAAAVKQMQGLADALLDATRPGDWNQSMMELGAVVCTPRNPRCGDCPVSAWCAALHHTQTAAEGGPAVTDYPVKASKPTRRVEAWEFPSAVSAVDEPATSRKVELDSLLARLGLPEANAGAEPRGGELAHVFSHVEHRMQVETVTLSMPGPPRDLAGQQDTWRWVSQPADCSEPAAMTSGVRKAWAAVFRTTEARAEPRKKARRAS